MRKYFCDVCGAESYLFQITLVCNIKQTEREFCQLCFEKKQTKLKELLLEGCKELEWK